MSEKYDKVRSDAVDIAKLEVKKKVMESTAENRGPEVDKYILKAGGKLTRKDGRIIGSEWCGMFVYYCYRLAADNLGLPLPFKASELWSGSKVTTWGENHPDTIIRSSPILPGDIYVTQGGHIGMAIDSNTDGQIFRSIDGNQSSKKNKRSLREKTQQFANMRLFVRI